MNKYRFSRTFLLAILIFLSSVSQADFSMTEYFPLPEGGTWQYWDTLQGEQITVKIVGADVINGTAVIQLDNGDGNIFSLTNDADGLRLHQVETDFPSARVVFNPPMPWANAQANVGDNLTLAGTADFIVPGAGSFSMKYTSAARIVTQEPINVPFGTFDTIRLQYTFGISGTVNGIRFDESETATLSLASGIGIVVDNESAIGSVFELIDTNACDASYSQSTEMLRLPVVNVGAATHSAMLRLVTLDQGNIGFSLESAEITACNSDHAATFDANTGKLLISRVDIFNNGVKSGPAAKAEMALVEGSSPLLFTLITVEDANNEPSNTGSLTGTWGIVETSGPNSCDDPSGIVKSYSAIVDQTGNSLTVQAPFGTLSGDLVENTITLSGSYPDDGGITTLTSMNLSVSPDGTTLSGSASWVWADGFDRCSGTTSLTGERVN